MMSPRAILPHWLIALALWAVVCPLHGSPLTGRQFFAFEHFDKFDIEISLDGSRLTSPLLGAGFEFDQIVVSWNIKLAPVAGLKIEAQPIFAGRTAGFYTLGYWSANTGRGAPVRQSVRHPSDPDGEVQTDVLVLSRPAQKCRVRLSIAHGSSPKREPTVLKFIGVSVLNSSTPPPTPPAAPEPARGLLLPVPTRSQLDYAGGDAWCSPTSLSMVLGYWAARLHRPDLDRDVPEVAAGVYDPGWPGTGNWPFNTAYAGSFAGMRGYVTRLGKVGELETWVRAGVPVVASVTYSILKGQPDQADGHLVVVVGFNENGDVQINDPGTRISMRKTVSRERFAAAWSKSHNTVYLVHPANHRVPFSPDGHW